MIRVKVRAVAARLKIVQRGAKETHPPSPVATCYRGGAAAANPGTRSGWTSPRVRLREQRRSTCQGK